MIDIMFFLKKISRENNLKAKWKYKPIKGKQIFMGNSLFQQVFSQYIGDSKENLEEL